MNFKNLIMDKLIIPSILSVGDTVYLADNLLRISQPLTGSDGKLKILYDLLSKDYARLVKNQKYSGKSLHTKTKTDICVFN